MLWWASQCTSFASLPSCESISVTLTQANPLRCRLLFGVLYWAILAIILPWLGNYALEEEVGVLKEGTTITKLVRVPRESDS